MSMIWKPRPGTRVRVIDGTLQNLHGTVVDHRDVRASRSPGKVIVKIDPPRTWCGESEVKIYWRKLHRVSRLNMFRR